MDAAIASIASMALPPSARIARPSSTVAACGAATTPRRWPALCRVIQPPGVSTCGNGLIFRPLPTDLPAFWWAVNHKASPAEKLSKGGCAARDLSQDLPHGGRHGKILEVFFDV